MLMADTMAIFLVTLGVMLAFPGLWLLCRGLWPDIVAGAAGRCRKGLWSSFLVGLPVTLMMAGAVAILFNVLGPLGKIAGAGLLCLYMVFAHAGVAGLATAVGQRLSSPADEARPWRATLRGGVVLELAYLLPILGWFVILPASIIIGCGGATLALMSQLKGRLTTRLAAPANPRPADAVGGPVGAAR